LAFLPVKPNTPWETTNGWGLVAMGRSGGFRTTTTDSLAYDDFHQVGLKALSKERPSETIATGYSILYPVKPSGE
jgi:hypothetical protein